MVGMEQIFGIDAEGHVTVKVRHKDGSEEVLYDGKNDIDTKFRDALIRSLYSTGDTNRKGVNYSDLAIYLVGVSGSKTGISPTINTSGNKITIETGEQTIEVTSDGTLSNVELDFTVKQYITDSWETGYLTLATPSQFSERSLVSGDQVIVNWTVEITLDGVSDISALNTMWTNLYMATKAEIKVKNSSGTESSVVDSQNNPDMEDDSEIGSYKLTWSGTYTASESITLTDVLLYITHDGNNTFALISRSIGSLDMQKDDSLTVEFTFQT